MKTLKILILLASFGIFTASCSKNDEAPEPTNAQKAKVWVNYSNSVAPDEKDIAYTVEYLDAKGIQTKNGIRGDFQIRVPGMTFDSAGTTYVRTMLKVKAERKFKSWTNQTLNSGMKIYSDYGFLFSGTSQSDSGCGYEERTITETKPLSWFRIK